MVLCCCCCVALDYSRDDVHASRANHWSPDSEDSRGSNTPWERQDARICSVWWAIWGQSVSCTGLITDVIFIATKLHFSAALFCYIIKREIETREEWKRLQQHFIWCSWSSGRRRSSCGQAWNRNVFCGVLCNKSDVPASLLGIISVMPCSGCLPGKGVKGLSAGQFGIVVGFALCCITGSSI